MKHRNNWFKGHTFDSDLDDVVCSAQAVCGCTAVVPSISFIHIRNLEGFLEVVNGRPAARQLSSILLPGDLWSGSVAEAVTTRCFFLGYLQVLWMPWQFLIKKTLLYHIIKFISLQQMPTYKPSAMHSSSRVSPLRTILVLVVPRGIMKPGRCSPSGLSEHMRTHDQIRARHECSSCHSVTLGGAGWNHDLSLMKSREVMCQNV